MKGLITIGVTKELTTFNSLSMPELPQDEDGGHVHICVD
jgi:hypothetical protein